MARLYAAAPSSLLRLSDPLTAWCLDEAIAQLDALLNAGRKLRPKKTTDNIALLKRMGIPIKGLN